MEENLQRVLNKIVVPAFKEIEEVRVTRMGLTDFFRVKYIINPPLENKTASEIMNETTSLFRMLGGNENSDILVDFAKK